MSSAASPPRLRHVPGLDGLRGLALLGVLAFHADGALTGGYLGVDLFFVLSGYLITSLLLAEQRDTGRIALSAFWARRARRLFPALLSLMPMVAIYGRYFAKSEELRHVRSQALAALAYVANWQAVYQHRSYWELFSAPSPLEHTWSLSIEEQFYVVWPLLVAVVLRKGSPRVLLGLSLALAALSMFVMVHWYDPGDSTRVYLGTDARMSGLVLGAAFATLVSPDRVFTQRAVRVLDGIGLLAALGMGLAWCTLRGSAPFLYHGGFWLTELGALVLIACALCGERSLIARALSVRPLTWLGTISYGVYLWHWPVNVFLSAERTHLHGLPLHALRFALTFAIALLSFRFLEQPIRKRGVPFQRPLVIVPAAVALSVFLVVHATYADGRGKAPEGTSLLSLAPPDEVTYRIAIVGDSTANTLGWTLRGLYRPGLAVELLGKDGCNMLEDKCDGEHWAERVRQLEPDATVIYIAGVFLYGFHVGGDYHTACHADWQARLEHVLTRRLDELRAEPTRVFLATVPYPAGPYETSRADRREFHEKTDCINAVIRRSAASVPGVNILDVAARLCPRGTCQQDVGANELVRPDGIHFSVEGARAIGRWAHDEIRNAPTP